MSDTYNQYIAIVLNDKITHVMGAEPSVHAALDSDPKIILLGDNPNSVIPGQGYDPENDTFFTKE